MIVTAKVFVGSVIAATIAGAVTTVNLFVPANQASEVMQSDVVNQAGADPATAIGSPLAEQQRQTAPGAWGYVGNGIAQAHECPGNCSIAAMFQAAR